MDHMETESNCSLCGEPYKRVEALSGTAALPLRAMPWYKMDELFPKAPYRLWHCCEHGAHTTCLNAMRPLASFAGPCVVCGATTPLKIVCAALNRRKLFSFPKDKGIPLLPPAKRMKVTEAEKNKNANDRDQNPPMAMPVSVPPKARPEPVAPWRKGRRK